MILPGLDAGIWGNIKMAWSVRQIDFLTVFKA
jgi:hypothetical protein